MISLLRFAPVLILSALWLAACGPASESTQTPPAVDTLSPQEAAIAQEFECLTRPGLICQTGLAFIQLGDHVATAIPAEVGAAEGGAAWSEGEGFEWLVRVINLPEGRLIVEGSFLDQRFIDDSLRETSTVNRLRIESPAFQTWEGLRVGSRLQELLAAFAGRDLGFTPIPDYGLIDIQADTSHIHFLVPLPDALPETFSPEALDPDLPVAAIVVM